MSSVLVGFQPVFAGFLTRKRLAQTPRTPARGRRLQARLQAHSASRLHAVYQHRCQRTRVQLQSVAQVIQAKAVAELSVEQAYHMAPRGKGARLALGTRRPRNLRHQKRRNVIANLAQDGELGAGWNYFVLIQDCRVAGVIQNLQFFLSISAGWL